MSVPELSILMPVYDEPATLEAAIADVLEADLPVQSRELVIVDDGSAEPTRRLLREGHWPENVRVLHHDRNRGKGAALQTALAAAKGTWATVMDADLEYPAANLAGLLEPLLSGRAEVVFGTRGFESHSAYSFWYVVGNKGVTLVANVLFDSWLSDIMTCHKAMPTALFRELGLRERGFAVEAEITARLLGRGIRIYEVPVTYRARSRSAGKKLTGTDGVRVLRTLLRCRLTTPRSRG